MDRSQLRDEFLKLVCAGCIEAASCLAKYLHSGLVGTFALLCDQSLDGAAINVASVLRILVAKPFSRFLQSLRIFDPLAHGGVASGPVLFVLQNPGLCKCSPCRPPRGQAVVLAQSRYRLLADLVGASRAAGEFIEPVEFLILRLNSEEALLGIDSGGPVLRSCMQRCPGCRACRTAAAVQGIRSLQPVGG